MRRIGVCMKCRILSALCLGWLLGCQQMGTSVAKPSPSVSLSSFQTTQNEKKNLISSCQMKLKVRRLEPSEFGLYGNAKTFGLTVDSNNCIAQNESLSFQLYVEGAAHTPHPTGPVPFDSVTQINNKLNRLDLCYVPIRGTNINYAVYAEVVLNKSKAVIRSNKVVLETLPDEFSQCELMFESPAFVYPDDPNSPEPYGYCPPGSELAYCKSLSPKIDK